MAPGRAGAQDLRQRQGTEQDQKDAPDRPGTTRTSPVAPPEARNAEGVAESAPQQRQLPAAALSQNNSGTTAEPATASVAQHAAAHGELSQCAHAIYPTSVRLPDLNGPWLSV